MWTELGVMLLVVGSSLWVLNDASRIGVRKGLVPSLLIDGGPGTWFVMCLVLWIVVFPMYLLRRDLFIEAVAWHAQEANRPGARRAAIVVDDDGQLEAVVRPPVPKSTVTCPYCGQELSELTVFVGQNQCWNCKHVFVAHY